MKAEGLLACLKKDRRTKNKWITVHKAREVCGYGGNYTREALERFAEQLPEAERKEACECKTLYRVDPPLNEPVTPLKWRPIAATLGAISLLAVGALVALDSRRHRELRLRHGEEDKTLDHKTVDGENFRCVCDSCFYRFRYDHSQSWEHSYNINGPSCSHCGQPATRQLKRVAGA